MSLHNELRQPSLEQAMKNHMKVVRAAVVLKHRIAADNELEYVLPKVRKELARQAQDGMIRGISVGDMLALVEGTDEPA